MAGRGKAKDAVQAYFRLMAGSAPVPDWGIPIAHALPIRFGRPRLQMCYFEGKEHDLRPLLLLDLSPHPIM